MYILFPPHILLKQILNPARCNYIFILIKSFLGGVNKKGLPINKLSHTDGLHGLTESPVS